MWRANIKNRTFDRMGEEWAPLIDPNHFLGRSAFDIPHHQPEQGPAASLVREGELLVLELDVSGYKREELQLEVKNDLLFVSGSKVGKATTVNPELVSRELHRDYFERVFKLAASIAREGVKAKYEDGVLRIQFVDVPVEEETTYRRVEIG